MPAFFITTYGRTASHWIAEVLDSHPDISCSHGSSCVPVSQHREDENAILLEAWSGRRDFYRQTLTTLVERIHAEEPTNIYGNIHGFTATNLYRKWLEESPRLPIRMANITRHPFTRMESFVERWHRYMQDQELAQPFSIMMEEAMHHNTTFQHMLQQMTDDFSIDPADWSNRLFIFALLQQSNDISDADTPIRHFQFEKLIAKPRYLQKLIQHITGNGVVLDTPYLQRIQRIGTRDAASGNSNDINAAVSRWQPWQIALVREWSQQRITSHAYRTLGYKVAL